jgi:hypothetical protein
VNHTLVLSEFVADFQMNGDISWTYFPEFETEELRIRN